MTESHVFTDVSEYIGVDINVDIHNGKVFSPVLIGFLRVFYDIWNMHKMASEGKSDNVF